MTQMEIKENLFVALDTLRSRKIRSAQPMAGDKLADAVVGFEARRLRRCGRGDFIGIDRQAD